MTVKEALKAILDRIDTIQTEEVSLLDALHRVGAEPITAGRDLPPWDNSSMDGYAVRSRDTETFPVVLNVVDEVAAGAVSCREVRAGEAVRIMTGAPLPDGADAVVRVEDAVALNEKRVRIESGIPAGENVRLRGEDVRKGEVVIPERTVMEAAEIGMCAAMGRVRVRVHQRPRVGILATGNEISEPGDTPGPHQIPDANSYSLAAQVRSVGGIPVHLGIARDDPKDLRQKLDGGLSTDLILISGGVSVGKYDYVKEVLASMGFEMSFWKVAMKPGHPLLFGSLGACRVFGLPGNPVSTLVTFEEFVRPALLKMAGYRDIFRPTIQAVCDETFKGKKDGKMHFIRVAIREEGGGYRVRSAGNQSSGAISSMVRADGLMIIPEDVERIEAGQPVVVQRLKRGLDRQAAPGF